MPRFNDAEKSHIQAQLRKEGAKRFIAHGIKKVTVEELARAANISKGSFYAFYPSKEHLYVDILTSWQQKVLDDLGKQFKKSHLSSPKAVAKAVVEQMMQGVLDSPFLLSTDAETLEMLRRKLPQETVDIYVHDGLGALKLLSAFGLTFTCDPDIAAKVLQVVFTCASQLQSEDEETRTAVSEILLQGVVDQIVAE